MTCNHTRCHHLYSKGFRKPCKKGAMTWNSMLLKHLIKSFEHLIGSFIQEHIRDKVQTKEANIFKVSQEDNNLLQEFVIRFQRERMSLHPVPDEREIENFTKNLNPRSSSLKLKMNLLEFLTTTWCRCPQQV